MKLSITVIVLLALTFSGYAATRPSASRAEAAARRVCLDRAQASGHRVQGVRSVDRKGRNNFRVTLRVEGVKRLLTCDYDERSGGTQLRW